MTPMNYPIKHPNLLILTTTTFSLPWRSFNFSVMPCSAFLAIQDNNKTPNENSQDEPSSEQDNNETPDQQQEDRGGDCSLNF
jgi:hypothetical protein